MLAGCARLPFDFMGNSAPWPLTSTGRTPSPGGGGGAQKSGCSAPITAMCSVTEFFSDGAKILKSGCEVKSSHSVPSNKATAPIKYSSPPGEVIAKSSRSPGIRRATADGAGQRADGATVRLFGVVFSGLEARGRGGRRFSLYRSESSLTPYSNYAKLHANSQGAHRSPLLRTFEHPPYHRLGGAGRGRRQAARGASPVGWPAPGVRRENPGQRGGIQL